MKKRLLSLFLILCISSAFSLFASATSEDVFSSEIEVVSLDDALISDAAFLDNMTISKKDLPDGSVEFKLTDQKLTKINPSLSEGTSNVAMIIATDKEEASIIEYSLQKAHTEANRIGGSRPNYNWYLGSSLYLESRLAYDQITSSGLPHYKMTSLQTKVSVNSGTSFKNRSVRFAVMAVSQSGSSYTNSNTVNISNSAASTYTVNAPSSWPYVREGAMLGASFTCTGVRSSGETQTYTLGNPIFAN